MKMSGGDFQTPNRETTRSKRGRRFRQPRPGNPDNAWEWKTTQRHPIDRLLDNPRRCKKKAKARRAMRRANHERQLTARTNNLRLKEARRMVASADRGL